jgi:DNA-binding response OmpR family regulator
MFFMGVGATIMVVEDEPNIGNLVRTYMAREGYTVIWVRSGEDALPSSAATPCVWWYSTSDCPGLTALRFAGGSRVRYR